MANKKKLPGGKNRCFNGQEGHGQRTNRQGLLGTRGPWERQDRIFQIEWQWEEREMETDGEETG